MLPQYGAWGPTPDLVPVLWSGALTGVVGEGTPSVCWAPALPTEPPGALCGWWFSFLEICFPKSV